MLLDQTLPQGAIEARKIVTLCYQAYDLGSSVVLKKTGRSWVAQTTTRIPWRIYFYHVTA